MKGLAKQLSSGLILGLGAVIYAISYAALMFTGALSPYVAYGLTVTLITAAAGGLYGLFAEESTFVSGPDSNTSSVLAGMMAALAATPLPARRPARGAGRADGRLGFDGPHFPADRALRRGPAGALRAIPGDGRFSGVHRLAHVQRRAQHHRGTPLSLDTVVALADRPWRPELAAALC